MWRTGEMILVVSIKAIDNEASCVVPQTELVPNENILFIAHYFCRLCSHSAKLNIQIIWGL